LISLDIASIVLNSRRTVSPLIFSSPLNAILAAAITVPLEMRDLNFQAMQVCHPPPQIIVFDWLALAINPTVLVPLIEPALVIAVAAVARVGIDSN
jgi:hypothetical protein